MSWRDVNHQAIPGPRDSGIASPDDSYGPCEVCSDETTRVHDAGIDGDDGVATGWIVYRCEQCEELLARMEDEPKEVTEEYRELQYWLAQLERSGRKVIRNWERGDLAGAVQELEKVIENCPQGRQQ